MWHVSHDVRRNDESHNHRSDDRKAVDQKCRCRSPSPQEHKRKTTFMRPEQQTTDESGGNQQPRSHLSSKK